MRFFLESSALPQGRSCILPPEQIDELTASQAIDDVWQYWISSSSETQHSVLQIVFLQEKKTPPEYFLEF